MPRKVRARRFAAVPVVSQSIIDAEVPYLAREVENYLLLSLNELDEKRSSNHALARRTWEEIQQFFPALNERECFAIQAILFRDFFHVARLVLTYLKTRAPTASPATTPRASKKVERLATFSEWLFEP